MAVMVSIFTFFTMKPSRGPLGCLFRASLIFSPRCFASAFFRSLLALLLRNSSLHLDSWTCSMRAWNRFLMMRFPTCTRTTEECVRHPTESDISACASLYDPLWSVPCARSSIVRVSECACIPTGIDAVSQKHSTYQLVHFHAHCTFGDVPDHPSLPVVVLERHALRDVRRDKLNRGQPHVRESPRSSVMHPSFFRPRPRLSTFAWPTDAKPWFPEVLAAAAVPSRRPFFLLRCLHHVRSHDPFLAIRHPSFDPSFRSPLPTIVSISAPCARPS
mmetsp:Transcript_7669/g.47350  ORF Transcript_7669/g.47350 Transcript_7669/m.47350 type:complete len:274 (-) Transcript_7669:195-1016(-)